MISYSDKREKGVGPITSHGAGTVIESAGVVVRTEKAMGRTVEGRTIVAVVSHIDKMGHAIIDIEMIDLTGCLLAFTVGSVATKVMFAGESQNKGETTVKVPSVILTLTS